VEQKSKEREVSDSKLREAVASLEEAATREVTPTRRGCPQGTWCRGGVGEEGFPGPWWSLRPPWHPSFPSVRL